MKIPEHLKPADGRFGCGPSKVRPEQLGYLADVGDGVMGTSHRQKPVKDVVGRVREGLRELFSLPDGLRGRARQRRHDGLLGRRDGRPGPRARAAPDLRRVLRQVRQGDGRRAVPRGPDRRLRRAGRRARARSATPSVDVIGWAHNETSTGVMVPVRASRRRRRRARPDRRHLRRRRPAGRRRPGRRLLLRAAEVLRLRRRALAGAAQPGGDRADRASSAPRPTAGAPSSCPCTTALDNSRKDQTYNTPALATLLLLADQIEWMNERRRPRLVRPAHERLVAAPLRLGRGLASTRRRSSPIRRSARWSSARSTSPTTSTPPPSPRRCAPTGSSTSSRTASSAATSCAIGMFPAIEPADVEALTACIDWIVENVGEVTR